MTGVQTCALPIYHLVFIKFDTSYVVTTVWASYHGVLMSTLFFYFNQPATILDTPPLFRREPVAA